MVKVTTTTNPHVHDDNTVSKTTTFECETKEEFVKVWNDRKYIPKSRKIKWSANIDKLEVYSEEWINFEDVLFPPEVKEYIPTEVDKRAAKILQIETWMENNPQFHETENWPIIEYCISRMNVVSCNDSSELFDNLMSLFILNSRHYEPACFYRGDEEE
tara:strand:+ start:1070 stop:1546 length:477 start_codon:yes stop_codon:yes gene_type:complete